MEQVESLGVSNKNSGITLFLSWIIIIFGFIVIIFSIWGISLFITEFDRNVFSFPLGISVFLLVICMISIVGILTSKVINILNSELENNQRVVAAAKEFFLFGGIQFSMIFVIFFLIIVLSSTD